MLGSVNLILLWEHLLRLVMVYITLPFNERIVVRSNPLPYYVCRLYCSTLPSGKPIKGPNAFDHGLHITILATLVNVKPTVKGIIHCH